MANVLRAQTQAGWRDYSIKHEGFTPFPYCDTLNLVTTGIGNLKDAGPRNGFDISAGAMAPFLQLPWKMRAPGWTSKNPLAGALADFPTVQQAFITCKLKEKEQPGFNRKGGFAYAGLTPITLDMQAISNLFDSTTDSFAATLDKTYPTFRNAPCDAQFACMSMAWAMGPAFFPVLGFQDFKKAMDVEDYTRCITACQFKGGGLRDDPASRNFQNALMFENAANVVKAGGDRNVLFFPGKSSSTSPILPVIATDTKHKLITAAEVGGGIAATVAAVWGVLEWRSRR